MAKPAAGTVPSNKLQLYEKLVATNPRVKCKNATVRYTSLNGHTFSYMRGKLALRLPPDQREVFLKKYNAKLEAYGVVQPAYVEVPASLLSTRELRKFFDASYSYVASPKPKPTARKKKPRS